jgi:biofilm PGA synthesis N-glycosyltransferase PgaC
MADRAVVMGATSLTYCVITPARDEAENLRRLGGCLALQTVRPSAWIIVDNGSEDETLDVAQTFARDVDWAHALSRPGEPQAAPGAPVVQAFRAGLEALPELPDVVVKLDADVSMEPDYFERHLAAFDSDPHLGIAGGMCLELGQAGWAETYVTGNHVRGASRAYRRECLEAILPLEEGMGWDTIDELKANLRGWRSQILRDVSFFHHRRVGERDGLRGERWTALGKSSYYMGYRFSYLLIRSLYRARTDRMALRMLASYTRAAVTRQPRYHDRQVRDHLRRQQRLRHLATRVRQSRGA